MLKRFLSPKLSNPKLNISIFMIRVVSGLLMVPHGYKKLLNFSTISGNFMSFLGLGGEISLALVVLAEFFCALFLIGGLLTRLVLIPLIIAMAVAVFKSHHGEIFGDGEAAFFYLASFLAIFIAGPGKWSADNYIFR